MSQVAQTLRLYPIDPTNPNPTGISPDVVALTNQLQGGGAPVGSLGVVGNVYTDVTTGNQYQKDSLGWHPTIALGSFAVVPDPLSVHQINVDTINGDTGQNVQVGLQTTGILNIGSTATPTAVSVHPDGTVILDKSTASVIVADGSGHQITYAPSAITSTAGLSLIGGTGVTMSSIAGDVQVDSANNVILNPANIITANQGIYMAGGQMYTSQSDGTSGVLVAADSVILKSAGNSVVSASTAHANFTTTSDCTFTVGGNPILAVQTGDLALTGHILPTAGFTYNIGGPANVWSEGHFDATFLQNGSAAQPSYLFESDHTTGVYLPAAGQLGLSAGGVNKMNLGATQTVSSQPIVLPPGSAATPSLTFSSDTSSGIHDNLPGITIDVSGTATLSVQAGQAFLAGNFLPSVTNADDLGSVALNWRNIYLVNVPIISSDATMKKEIKTLSPMMGIDFIENLRPVSYQWIEGDDYKDHFGFIAQEVESSLADRRVCQGASSLIEVSKDGKYMMRTQELIPSLVLAIQDLSKYCRTLEVRLVELERLANKD